MEAWEITMARKKAFVEKLYRDFPNLYWEPVRLGVSIGPGWFDLVYALSAKLEELAKKLPPQALHVRQIKEKFGTLRYYASGPPEVQPIIREAEKAAMHVCEECGAPGAQQVSTGYARLCEVCAVIYRLKGNRW